MSDAFETAFARTNGIEGKHSKNPNDAGGETMWGVTARLARQRGYMGPMDQMPLEEARRIAKVEFWDTMNLDAVALKSYAIAEELYDTRFNTGQCFLQRCLNRFNRQEKLYPDVEEDGRIGGQTLAALAQYLEKRGKDAEKVMLRALNSLQGAYYLTIADEEHRKLNEDFVYGWVLNRVEIE